MTTPCEHLDDIKEIRKDLKSMKDSFETFRLNASVDIATLKGESRKSGGIWGAIASIIIAIASMLSTKLGA